MNALWQRLAAVGAELERRGHSYALLGGLAVSARAQPRFTSDIDLAVAVASDEEAERLVRELVAAGNQIDFVVEQEAVERIASVRLSEPADRRGIVIDFLFASSGIESEIVAAAESLEIAPGLVVPVARAGHLLVLKLLSRDDDVRPQDAIDIKALLKVIGADDIALADTAAHLVQARGYARGRDVVALLTESLGR